MYKVAMFSTKSYDKASFLQHSNHAIEFSFFNTALTVDTAGLARGFHAVCVFVNDDVTAPTIKRLSEFEVKAVVLRCSGFNNVDIVQAKRNNIRVANVPAYSPEAVAEHTIALMLSLNRKIHKAYNRTKENNFDLQGLLGFNFHKKTAGLIGTGEIGLAAARILNGFGVHVLAFDPNPNLSAISSKHDIQYVELDELFERSDIISLHCPLTEANRHMINHRSIEKMKHGVMLVNTSRGGLIDSQSLISEIKSGHIGYLAMDVYENENALFFEDRSSVIVQDDVLQRLLTFPNVLITGHQAFFTKESLGQIATTTINNLLCFADNSRCDNELIVV
ncbi:D-lactate dehydrogenase [invertebrate metagenome]|uniref:D-lactate dehydrogenase n=1 Tax=invertebrate metagenome TaxID=1711999 RepID=A0A2H9T265_9ZZZZ